MQQLSHHPSSVERRLSKKIKSKVTSILKIERSIFSIKLSLLPPSYGIRIHSDIRTILIFSTSGLTSLKYFGKIRVDAYIVASYW